MIDSQIQLFFVIIRNIILKFKIQKGGNFDFLINILILHFILYSFFITFSNRELP